MMALALVFAGILILANLPFTPARLHTLLSSLPLAIAGIAYAILQLRTGQRRLALLKRLFLAATFLTWAVDQLLSAGKLSTFIGDAVIAAYVLDLHWAVQEQVSTVGRTDSVDGANSS